MTIYEFFIILKSIFPPASSYIWKGGNPMDGEDRFKELFRRIVELYQLSPETAEELLQRILRILAEGDTKEPPS